MPEPDALISKIDSAFKETQQARQDYLVNRAFLQGRQHVFFDQRHGIVRDLPSPADRYRVTANRVWPNSRSLISAMLRRPLQFQVMPESADAASARASRLAESVVRGRVQDRAWEDLRADLTWGLWLGGTAALAIDWDPTAERPLGLTDKGRKYGTGDTAESALTILDFAVAPGSTEAERARWWVRQEALPPEGVKERYGLVDEPAADSVTARVYGSTGTPDPRLTIVSTYYERPHGDSKGRVAVVVGKEVVDEAPWPFPFSDRLNLRIVKETVVPGRWYGDTVVTAAVPVQAALNAAFSALIDHTRKAGNVRLLIPQSVADMIDDLTDDAGQVLAYPDGAEPPTWHAPPSLPNYVIEAPKVLQQELDDMLSVHAISRGDAPGRVDSGLGLSILTENDATPLSAITSQVARAFSGLGEMLLSIYATKVKDTRRQKVHTPGQVTEETAWTGRDLLSHTRAQVPPDALVPKSRTASNQLAIDMWQAGIITDPIQALKLIEFPDVDDAIQALDPHVAKARREFHRVMAGFQQIPDDVDGPTHVQEHMLAKLTESYELSSAEQQQLYVDHLEAHRAVYEAEGRPWPQVPGMPEPQPPAAPPSAGGALPLPGEVPPAPLPPFDIPPQAPPLPPQLPSPPGVTDAAVVEQLLADQIAF